MNKTKEFHQQLSRKFYIFNCGFLAAVLGVLGGMQLLNVHCGLPVLAAIFISYFLVVLGRAFYEQLAIWELTLKQISLKNNLILALLGACVLSGLYYFLRTPFGDWAVPATVILSMKVIGEIKKILWPSSSAQLSEVLKAYAQKISTYVQGMYSFFLVVALGTYYLVQLLGPQSFYYAFAVAVFAGVLVEQLYDFVAVYEIKLSVIVALSMIIPAAIYAILGTGLVWYLMHVCGYSGKAATICGVLQFRLMVPVNFLRGAGFDFFHKQN